MTGDDNTPGTGERQRDTSEPVKFYWLRPHRGRRAKERWVADNIIEPLGIGARRAGFEIRLIDIDDLAVEGTPEHSRLFVDGRPVEPESCLFHTKFMNTPVTQADTWRYFSTCALLESLGFCTTVPTMANVVWDDKLLTLLQARNADVPWLPTLRVPTRQFLSLKFFGPFTLDFPVVVKPATWGAGNGINLARDGNELDSILQLAGAAELTMVVQPWLGPDVTDVRVYCVDGEPVRARRRIPRDGKVTANAQQGGDDELLDVPSELIGTCREIARATDLSYLSVDFLERKGNYWVSEVEPDAGTGRFEELVDLRFGAYRRRFDRFLATRPV
jgi:hypothetical protein